MGQQQLLLIVLGIIVVAIAVLLGIWLFNVNAVDAKRNNVINELVNLSAMAHGFYLRPVTMGGGGHTFTGWKVPGELKVTANGSYMATVFQDSVVVTGTGNEVVTGTDSVKVKISVYSNTYKVSIIK
jgi:hypothetical protein